MKIILFIFTTFLSFGQEDKLGSKVISSLGSMSTEVEVIDMCMTYFEPSFEGGNVALMEYISKRLTYPQCAMSHISGKIYVSFTVELDGELTDIQVFRSPCPDLDAMIIDLFDKMPL